MDEYLFITLAKLKADRLTLERERRVAEPDPEQLPLELADMADTHRSSGPRPARNSPVRNWIAARWSSQQPLWREQS